MKYINNESYNHNPPAPTMPDFKNHIRAPEAGGLKLDLNKLKLDIVLNSQDEHPFTKKLLVEGKYALVITYNGIGAYVLSFDEIADGIIVRQLQGVKSRVNYKISTTLDSINFYLDFFYKNFVGKIDRFEVPDVPSGLEDLSIFNNGDPLYRYMFFKERLDKLTNR